MQNLEWIRLKKMASVGFESKERQRDRDKKK